MIATCKKWQFIGAGTRASQVTAKNGITLDDLMSWNPCIDKADPEHGVWAEYWYCVGV
jgi:hypothetical protein